MKYNGLKSVFGKHKATQIQNSYLIADVDKRLERINEILGGHGIEPIRHESAWVSQYYQDIIALYVNMGDTYSDTIVYDTEQGRFYNCSWGSWFECWESNNVIRED